jgi:quinohemoprotein ethanol dehydrogenase
LRRTPELLDKDAWNHVVIQGALKDDGMVSFAKYLSADEAESIRAYVSSQAANLGFQ